ncbi:hypothetical protein PENSPDRAFT_360985 [Peniophora sp. CONT]|nr:hypothetical protein PENSPDRAFT_360985 [Peniophora sp. CONT]
MSARAHHRTVYTSQDRAFRRPLSHTFLTRTAPPRNGPRSQRHSSHNLHTLDTPVSVRLNHNGRSRVYARNTKQHRVFSVHGATTSRPAHGDATRSYTDDSLTDSSVPPSTLSYAPSSDAAESQVSTSPLPYDSFVRLSSDVLANMARANGHAPALAFTGDLKPVHAISEDFVRVLDKLDAVPSRGDSAVREARKSEAGAVEGEAARLEAWLKVVWFSRNGEGDGMPQPTSKYVGAAGDAAGAYPYAASAFDAASA